MRKVNFIIISILLLTTIGCSNREVIRHHYVYTGENENWTAEYKVDGTGTFTKKDDKLEYKSNSEKKLTVTYKKDLSELSTVNHLEISYKSSAGAGKLTFDSEGDQINQKSFILSGASSGGAIEDSEETIITTITLDGKTEIIELKDNSK